MKDNAFLLLIMAMTLACTIYFPMKFVTELEEMSDQTDALKASLDALTQTILRECESEQ